MKPLVMVMIACVVGLASELRIKPPLHPMDYHKFSQTLNGDPKQDMPRIAGLIARNLSACYVRAHTLAGNAQESLKRVKMGCEIEAYNMANVPIHRHYAMRGELLEHDEIQARKEQFFTKYKAHIYESANELTELELGL
ncbi:hypothetical protein [Helicobacter canis]|uniref:Uncharacterized protein n=1 Tax=Helicobacter canis TaxID=29419 RepID=A0A5M9QMT9_9HELI|nr:hypothetical protein [Helicobacter canis]KAA8709580.1 hypothetical protein F4V45_04700 [Helicobacter canis]